MKTSPWIKRLILTLGIATILGCSGLSSLMVGNRSDKAVHLVITPHHAEEGRMDAWSGRIAPGERVETLKWISSAPASLTVEGDWGDGKRTFEVAQSQYPPGMREGSSAKSTYFMDVDKDGVRLSDPSYFRRMLDQPHIAFAHLLTVLFFVGIILLIRVALRLTRRISSRK